MWLAALIGWLALDDVDAARKLVVPIDEIVELDVGYAVGFRCDDVKIIEPAMRSKSETANVFVVKGLALGQTQCRVGTNGQGPTALFDVHVVAKPVRKR